MDKPGYWAVLPANVRYDTRLRPAARLLYCEISALCNRDGYCTAGNSYFADLYETSKKTVESWMRQLKACGYIHVEVIKDDTKAVIGRKIWIKPLDTPPLEIEGTSPIFRTDSPLEIGDTSPLFHADPPLEIEDTSPIFRTDPPLENASHNNININNIPPITPHTSGDKKNKSQTSTTFADYAKSDMILLNALLAFEADRAERKNPMTERAKILLCKRLDKLGQTPSERIALLEHAIVMGWKSVYPIDRDKKSSDAKSHAQSTSHRRELQEL